MRERERERERDCKVLLENIDHQFSIFFLVLDPTNVPWMLVVSISFVLVVVEWGGGGCRMGVVRRVRVQTQVISKTGPGWLGRDAGGGGGWAKVGY